MRVATIAYRSGEIEERKAETSEMRESLMTPARRAGLEALEREFHEFLKRPPR